MAGLVEGKATLITGAASGIGAAAARIFAREGARLVLSDIQTELGTQVAKELEQLGQYRGVRTLPIYGGVAYGPQLEGLERGAHIVVGTPGRILDHLKNNRASPDLDEVGVLAHV